MTRPETTEYGAYYHKYISLVPDGDIVATLERQLEETRRLFAGVPESLGGHRYGPDKWTIREMIGHMIDCERIFAYRALRIARNDKTSLPGFEQDDFIAAANFDARTIADLIEEFAIVRQASLALFRHLTDEAWMRVGTASDNPLSARAAAWITAGHELYHHEILTARYLAK
ncbi:MAG: DinB family protein [Blastocatellia bacterium]|nr:DinB family protein [Blastocatellia bacterium]